MVLTGHFSDRAILWDTQMGTPIRSFRHRPHSGPVFTVEFHPQGDQILTGGADSYARLWNCQTGEELTAFRHDTACSGTFDPSGGRILTVGSDHYARQWNANTHQPIGPPLRHRGCLTGGAFSQDGRTLLTCSIDGTARLWDVATCKQLGPSFQHSERVLGAAFWPDDQTIVTETGKADHINSPIGEAKYWRIPQSVSGTDTELTRWAEVITGSELKPHGGVSVLKPDEWAKRSSQLPSQVQRD